MDQLRAIRTFLAVVDRGGFAGAARALDQSTAVVTRLVAELENHLGIPGRGLGWQMRPANEGCGFR